MVSPPIGPFVPNIAPGTQKDSVGNFDYHEGQPTFPDMSDPAWGPIAVGNTLHTCTAVVLHSPDDPLMVPDGSGGMMAIQDIWFDTVDPSPTRLRARSCGARALRASIRSTR